MDGYIFDRRSRLNTRQKDEKSIVFLVSATLHPS